MHCDRPLILTMAHVRGEIRRWYCDSCRCQHEIIPPADMADRAFLESASYSMEAYGLTPTEGKIFALLAARLGHVVTQGEVIERVWGAEYAGETHLLRVNISRMRAKLTMSPSAPLVNTIHGIGYRMNAAPVALRATA